jgi:hypothetical protein
MARTRKKKDPLDGFRDVGDSDDALAEFDRNYIFDAAFKCAAGLQSRKRDGIWYILQQALDDARQANAKLVTCDPTDAAIVRQLQWEVGRFDELYNYVYVTLQAGELVRKDMTEEQVAVLNRELGNQDATGD